MPTFDISSEYNQQEVVNAVDQAHRENAKKKYQIGMILERLELLFRIVKTQ